MASKIEKDDLLTCPICFEYFTNPKCLPCLHTFCYQCLRSYIISQLGGEGKKAGPFPCPFCRQEVSIPDPSLTAEKIADTMPINRLMTSLIDQALASGERKQPKLCDPCNYDGRKIPAVMWCTVCLEGMCENCTFDHERIKLGRNHKSSPIADVPEESQTIPLLEVDEPCVKHAGKDLEAYCSYHKEMCCALCLATNHRECKHISTQEKLISGSENSESVEDFVSFLKEVNQKFEEVQVKTEHKNKSLDKKKDEISQEISDAVQRAKDRLYQLESKFLTNLRQTHKDESTQLTERKERVEIFQNYVNKADKLLDAVREQGSPKQLFVTKEKIKVQLLNQIEILNEALQDVDHVDYSLKLRDTMAALNESMTALAELEINKTTGELWENVFGMQNITDKLCNKEPETTDISKIKVTEVCEIGSSYCCGGTFLPDERLVLCCGYPHSLQAYQTKGSKLFEIRLNDQPWDVCVLSSSEIVVSFPKAKCLKKYEIVQDTFIQKNTLYCKYEPEGLVATTDNVIVGYAGGVDIISLDCQYIRTITRFSRSGFFILTDVAMTRDGCVCYGHYDDVVCVTLDGKELSRFNNSKLKGVHGITVDKYENIYVCGFHSKNVNVFSPDGKTQTTLIENIPYPTTIGFNRQRNRLFIKSNKGVLIYDVRYGK